MERETTGTVIKQSNLRGNISGGKSIADQFNSQYSSVVQHKSSSFSRIVKRNIAKNTLSDAPSFTPTQTAEAIRKSKTSKALGPDGLSNVHMKHLGPAGIAYLTKIYNLSMETSIIPDIWKHSIIIPLLKPGKDASESKSYRPVSLLCPTIKILERLILPSLNENLPIPDFQHGFRKNHSTVSALHDFNVDVTNGFNKKRPPNRTILVQLDLSKAFDMVNHDKLLSDINNTTLPGATKRWLSTYLRGRQSKVSFRDTTSKFWNLRTGVPKGAVTSPLLFSFYLTKLLMPLPQSKIKLIQYANDICICLHMWSEEIVQEDGEGVEQVHDSSGPVPGRKGISLFTREIYSNPLYSRHQGGSVPSSSQARKYHHSPREDSKAPWCSI